MKTLFPLAAAICMVSTVTASNEAADSALIQACRSGDAEAAKAALANQANPNAAIPNSSPLGTALLFGHEAVALLLIEAGANPNQPNKVEQTPLMLACFRGSEPIVKALIAAKCELDTIDRSRNSALMYACAHFKTKPQLVTDLLEAGASPLAIDKARSSALDYALTHQHEELYQLLLSKADKANPKFKESLQKSLRTACEEGDVEQVKQLAALGIPLDCYKENDKYKSPLITALQKGHPKLLAYLLEQKVLDLKNAEQVEMLLGRTFDSFTPELLTMLLDYGISPNAKSSSDIPLLNNCLRSGLLPSAKLLLQRGADPKLKDKDGIDACLLTLAFAYEDSELLQLCGISPDLSQLSKDELTKVLGLICDSYYQFIHNPVKGKASLVEVTCPHDQQEAYAKSCARVKELISLGADPNGCQTSPLRFAYNNDDWELIAWLVQQGADINKVDDSGYYLISLALSSSDSGLAKAEKLIQLGADINTIRPRTGRPAFAEQLAYLNPAHQAQDMMDFLEKHGADFRILDKEGRTLLFYAQQEFIPALLKAGVDIHHIDKAGNSAFSHELSRGYDEDKALLLLKAGAKADILNEKGDTTIMLAVSKSYKNIIKKLLELGLDINATNEQGDSAYLLACSKHDRNLIQLLVSHGAKTKHVNADGDNDLLCYLSDWRSYSSKFKKSSSPSAKLFEDLIAWGADVHHANKDGICPLHAACGQAATPAVAVLLKAGAKINAQTKNGNTPLMATCSTSSDSTELCQMLLRAGADPNVANQEGDTPLMAACREKKLAVAQALIEAGAQVNTANEFGTTALMEAMATGSQAMVDLLLRHGADKHAKNKAGKSMLMHAALSGNIKLLDAALCWGDQVNDRTTDGKSPLIFACEKAQVKTIQYLLERGADPNAVDVEGQSTLMDICAIWGGEQSNIAQGIELLLKSGADVTAQDHEGRNALLACCSASNPVARVKRLLDAGADIKHRDKQGMNLLLLLAENDNLKPELLTELVQLGADEKAMNAKGQSLLHFSTKAYHGELLAHLLKQGWDANMKDAAGKTPLFYACAEGYMQNILSLISAGADRLILSTDGQSILHAAAQNDEVSILEGVLLLGLELDALDAESNSPLFYACKGGYRKNIHFLLTAGADPKRLNKKGQSMLHAVCMGDNSPQVLRQLFALGLDANAVDTEGNTPYLLACQHGDKDMLDLLLKAGAKTGTVNKAGKTELMASCQNNYFDVFELVLSQGGDINAVDAEGKTALIYACSEGREAHACTFTAGNFKVVQALHTKGADWTLKDKNGKTAADYAKIQNNPAILKLISEIEEQFSN